MLGEWKYCIGITKNECGADAMIERSKDEVISGIISIFQSYGERIDNSLASRY